MSLYFTPEHEWLQIDGDTATVGITVHAQDALGDVVFVDLPEVGSSFAAKDVAGVVESVKAAADIYMPVDGEVVEVNEALRADPALANTDPLAAKVPPLPVGPSASPALNSMPMGAPMMNRPGSLPSNSPLNNSLYTSNPMLPNTRDTYTNYTDSRILPSQPLQPGVQMPNPQMMPPQMAGSGFGGQLPPPNNQGFMGQGGQTFPQNNPSMGYPPMNPQMGGGAGIQGGYMVPGRNPYAAGQVGGQPMAMPPQQQLPPPPGYAPPAQVYVPGGVSAGGQMYSPTAAPRPAGNFY